MSPPKATPARPESAEPLVDEDLLAEMVRALVDRPEAVRVEAVTRADAVELQVHVDPADRRHVIGRKGWMVMLLRQFFGVLAAHRNGKTTIEIIESAEERARLRGPRRPSGALP